jgi:hypothetical protein
MELPEMEMLIIKSSVKLNNYFPKTAIKLSGVIGTIQLKVPATSPINKAKIVLFEEHSRAMES